MRNKCYFSLLALLIYLFSLPSICYADTMEISTIKNLSGIFIKEVFSQNGEVKDTASYIDPSSIKFNEYLTRRSEVIKNRINAFDLKHDNLVIKLKFDSINCNGEFCEVKVVSTEKYDAVSLTSPF